MKVIDGKICEECGTGASAYICDGCGKILCIQCHNFEIWNYGCGHADTKAFCNACYNNPEINPWRPE